MASGHKVYFIILEIVAQLLFFTGIRAGEVRPSDNATEQEIVRGPEYRLSLCVLCVLCG